jgi:hypothetical protein
MHKPYEAGPGKLAAILMLDVIFMSAVAGLAGLPPVGVCFSPGD